MRLARASQRSAMLLLAAATHLAHGSAPDLTVAELEAVHCGESDLVAFCLANVHDTVTAKVGLDHVSTTPCQQKFLQLEKQSKIQCQVSAHDAMDPSNLRNSLKTCLHCAKLLHFATRTPAPTPAAPECERKCAMHVNNKFKQPIFTEICRRHKGRPCSIRPWMDTFHSDDDVQTVWKEKDLPLDAVGESCYCMSRCRLPQMICDHDSSSVAEQEIIATYKTPQWVAYPLFLMCNWAHNQQFLLEYCSDDVATAKRSAIYTKKYPTMPNYCADGQKSRATYTPNAANGEYVAAYKCSECEPGKYSQPGLGVHDRQSFCVACPRGKFGTESGQSDCKWCNPHGCGNIPGFPSSNCAQDKFCHAYVQDPDATDTSSTNPALGTFSKITLPPTPVPKLLPEDPVEAMTASGQQKFDESEYQAFVAKQVRLFGQAALHVLVSADSFCCYLARSKNGTGVVWCGPAAKCTTTSTYAGSNHPYSSFQQRVRICGSCKEGKGATSKKACWR
jgi:hypothetical protein